MKKINNKGFILAETLVVSIFLTLVFTMIYSNFYPIIGEYEKRESYDDVDGKYGAYWIKRMIESDTYFFTYDCPDNSTCNSLSGDDKTNCLNKIAQCNKQKESTTKRINMMNQHGYMRFECDDISEENNQREVCKGLVNLLEVANCDKDGNGCDIFITRYQIGTSVATYSPDFKEEIRNSVMLRKQEFCADKEGLPNTEKEACYNSYFKKCCISEGLYEKKEDGTLKDNYDYKAEDIKNSYPNSEKTEQNNKVAIQCRKYVNDKVFNTATKDYILSLPNYSKKHMTTDARFRIIIVFHHTKDDNDYYSFSNMEVNK